MGDVVKGPDDWWDNKDEIKQTVAFTREDKRLWEEAEKESLVKRFFEDNDLYLDSPLNLENYLINKGFKIVRADLPKQGVFRIICNLDKKILAFNDDCDFTPNELIHAMACTASIYYFTEKDMKMGAKDEKIVKKFAFQLMVKTWIRSEDIALEQAKKILEEGKPEFDTTLREGYRRGFANLNYKTREVMVLADELMKRDPYYEPDPPHNDHQSPYDF